MDRQDCSATIQSLGLEAIWVEIYDVFIYFCNLGDLIREVRSSIFF